MIQRLTNKVSLRLALIFPQQVSTWPEALRPDLPGDRSLRVSGMHSRLVFPIWKLFLTDCSQISKKVD